MIALVFCVCSLLFSACAPMPNDQDYIISAEDILWTGGILCCDECPPKSKDKPPKIVIYI